MNDLLSILNAGDICPLVVVALLVYAIGGSLRDEPQAVHWRRGWAGLIALLFAWQAWRAIQPSSSMDIFSLVGRSLLVGAFVFGIAGILLPAVTALHRHTVGACLRRLSSGRQRRKARDELRRQQLESRRRELEYERSVPERQHAEREAEARAEVERLAQKRRADARAKAEHFYSLHAPELGSRFSKSDFTDYIARHLGDTHPPEYVEGRAQEFLALLKQHLAKVETSLAGLTLEQILSTFDDRIRRIRDSSLDERDKKNISIQLDQEREEAIQRAVREGRL